jgi:flagellar protein FliO/FliZ
MFEGLFGAEVPFAVQLCLAFLIVLGLIWAAAWLLSRSGRERLEGASGRQLRLAIIDSASFKGSRRLILIRRDNVEHLLMIGGPTDVVVESNIQRARGTSVEVPVTPSPASPEPLPPSIPQLKNGTRPLLPKAATTARLERNDPLPQLPPVGQLPAEADAITRLQRAALAELASELSSRPPALRNVAATVARPRPIEPRTEPVRELPSEPSPKPRPDPGLEHRVKPQFEPPVEPLQLAQPTAAEAASTADEDLAELARLLEAKLRKPNVPSIARLSGAPAPAVPPQQRAPAVEAAPTPPSPMHDRPQSQPKPPRADAKPDESTTPGDSLEQQLANLLGRPTKN